ncbi:MAG TPA: site-2 protease family protein [Blastocatellia bacterium]|nr:site-2 protease family protein [Blastocatellia bacterium]
MALKLKPLYLGRISGIPVRAHYSWLPVFPFYAWAISSAYLPNQVRGLEPWEYWVLGFLTTFLLFVSVLAHELAHSLMARVEGIGTSNITLYMFGGLATLEGQPARPSSEFKIAVVGPAASFLIGMLYFVFAELSIRSLNQYALAQVLRHLGLVNWFLAGFNILPGMPLDGGRVLRAILWRLNKNYRAATQIAVKAGFTISLALLVGGTYMFISSDFGLYITGIWSVAIGLMLALTLLTSRGMSSAGPRAKPGTVEAIMARDIVMITPDINVQDFIDRVLRNNHQTTFAVALNSRLHGMVMLEDLKTLPRDEWPIITAGQVMRPVDESMFINASAPVADARARLSKNGLGRLVVLDSEGYVIGSVAEEDLARA